MFHDIPHDRKDNIAHTRVVCKVRPTKADPNRTRVTIGGNTINYIGDCGTKTASLETVKLVVNSTLSTPNAEYMTMDLANFYLGTPLEDQNSLESSSPSSRKKSSTHMALTNMPTMDGYILKSVKECTASNKQANSPTNC